MNQKGFSMALFTIVIFLTIIVFGAIVYWTQNINKNPTVNKPASHLQQIENPFASPTPTDATGQDCGGFAGAPCPTGFTCILDSNNPDAGGKCVKE